MRILYIWFYSRSFPDYPKVSAVLREQGHDAWVANYDDTGDIVWMEGDRKMATVPGPSAVPASVARVPGLRSLWRKASYFGFMRRLRAFFRAQDADIVHVCPNNASMIWTLPVMMPRSMRFVVDYRQIAQRDGRGVLGKMKAAYSHGLRSFYCRHLFDRATFLHAAGAEKVLGNEWPRWANVVPLGVDDPFLLYSANGQGPEHKSPESDVSFLYLGSIARVRKLEQILAAVDQMRATTTNFHLDFIGPDAADGYYQKLVAEMGLGDVVRFLPPVPYDTVPQTVAGYDVTLTIVPESPADWQFQPTIKGVEYRALGMPVIATDFVPNRELVEDGVNGLLVTNTAASIAEAMLRFVQDPTFLSAARANARAMREGPTWDKIAEMYLHDVYEPLVNEPLVNEQPAHEKQA